ncbi:MAG: transcription elongation factor GreA [Anaerolineae bacterium]|nr:transcription elongation factor GreA [Anaerolineae bacterium]
MSIQNEHYLTPEGAARLRAELEDLKGPKREELSRRLREAIQQGDLSENADYIKTKEDQGFLEGRIQELEVLLADATIIEDGAAKDGAVGIGSWITIQEGSEAPEKYHLVGATEANPREGRISNESPIGIAVIGNHAGDKVTVETPGGSIELKILKVE